jgi:hypothetical protein
MVDLLINAACIAVVGLLLAAVVGIWMWAMESYTEAGRLHAGKCITAFVLTCVLFAFLYQLLTAWGVGVITITTTTTTTQVP